MATDATQRAKLSEPAEESSPSISSFLPTHTRTTDRASARASDGIIALLGKRDSPSDAVEDYCKLLGNAFQKRGEIFGIERVPWAEWGWLKALRRLSRESVQWRGQWVLVQYTALSWSRRGVPIGFLLVMRILRQRGVRVGLVFHDPEAHGGSRPAERVRSAVQRLVMRMAHRWANRVIITVPSPSLSWLPGPASKTISVPVGANIPALKVARNGSRGAKTIAVFGITGGGVVGSEIADIAFVLRETARCIGRVRLLALGRGSFEAGEKLRSALEGSEVDLVVLGFLSSEDVSRTLAEADVLLFVRGGISGQRGSSIAGIACGLPIVAYSGRHTGPPITDAGVVLVPQNDRKRLADALIQVLTDDDLRHRLHEMSQRAFEQFFDWDVIAERFLAGLVRA